MENQINSSCKRCSKCNQILPLENFYTKKYKSKSGIEREYLDSICKKCKNEKSALYNKINKDKAYAYTKSWRNKNPEAVERTKERFIENNPSYYKNWADNNKYKIRLSQIKYNYGLSKDEFECLPKHCEACGSQNNLCIDHCHTTGKVRGILCHKCNTALGFLDEDIDRIHNLTAYINKHKGSK